MKQSLVVVSLQQQRCFPKPQRNVTVAHQQLPKHAQRRGVVLQAASSRADTSTSIELLKEAAKTKSVKSVQVFEALRDLEKAKRPPEEEWQNIIGAGKRWQLVFTTGTKEVQAAMKGKGKGGGNYFPLTAAQRWDASTGEIENGIYLGLLAALTFQGAYEMRGKKLSFDFDTLNLKVGPWKLSFPIKDKLTSYKASPKDPFFLIFYVDEDIIAARGRGGGIAFWKKANSDFDMKNLV